MPGGDTGAYPQASSLVAGGDGPNKKPISAFCYTAQFPVRSMNVTAIVIFSFRGRPAEPSLPYAPKAPRRNFSRGLVVFFRGRCRKHTPLFFSVGMNYVTILLKGERFDGARFLTPPVLPPVQPLPLPGTPCTPPHAPGTARAQGQGRRRPAHLGTSSRSRSVRSAHTPARSIPDRALLRLFPSENYTHRAKCITKNLA